MEVFETMATYAFTVNGEQQAYEVSDAGWAFFQACAQDPALREQADGLASVDAVAELGRTRGFGTTYDNISRWSMSRPSRTRRARKTGELTDDELDLVSGGFGVTDVTTPACRGPKCVTCCASGKSCSDCYCPKPCR